MEKGFLYVANQPRFVREAKISVTSLKRFNHLPTCIVCTPDLCLPELKEFFDIIITSEDLSEHTYLAKIIGMQLSPFYNTVFLDGDTFITDEIEELYDLLEIVDFATTLEAKQYS